MKHNFTFRDINAALPALSRAVLAGEEIGSRAGRTKELTHVGITLREPWRREIILPERKANLAAQIAETMWVLSGRDDVEWLSHYLPRAKEFSDDGETWRGAYGARIRHWGLGRERLAGGLVETDQLAFVIGMLRQNPADRRAVIQIYDPAIDSAPGKDIPCNDWLHFLSRDGYLDLHVAVRSNDLMWGWSGINAFEWSVLLEITAGMLGMRVGQLHFSTSSLHLYDRHWDRAEKITATRTTASSDNGVRFYLRKEDRNIEALDRLFQGWFQVEEWLRLGDPRATDDLIGRFPEPMMRSWLYVLKWWWTGEVLELTRVGHALHEAAFVSVQRKVNTDERPAPNEQVRNVPPADSFSSYWSDVHQTKHAAYGDSWKRRGEKVGILANIARKVDRLGKTDDLETAADTAGDLLVYLIKYRWWLYDQGRMGAPFTTPYKDSDDADRVAVYLQDLDRFSGWSRGKEYEAELQGLFEQMLEDDLGLRLAELLQAMILNANSLARKEYWKAGNAKRTWKGYGE